MWQLSGIRLILPWLCSLRLSILRRLEHVFVSAWGWRVSILQKSLRLCFRFCFCLLICSLVSGIRPVFAQSTFVIVSGVSGDCSYLNGTYNYVDQVNGRSRYNFDGTHNIYWTNTQWIIDNPFAEVLYYSSDNVTEPYNVSTWVGSYCSGAFGSVSQGFQPTTTPTFHPLFPTSTPPAPGDYTCPGYQPIGAGTVTPAADWLLKCAQCITPISRYTWPTAPVIPTTSWDFGTATPVPTATSTPTGTYPPVVDPPIENQMYSRPVVNQVNISIPQLGQYPRIFGVERVFQIDSFWVKSGYGGRIEIKFQTNAWLNELGYEVEIIESDVPSLPVGLKFEIGHTFPIARNFTILEGVGNTTLYNRRFEIKYNITIKGKNSSGMTSVIVRDWVEMNGYQAANTGHSETTWFLDGVPVIPPPIVSDCSTIPSIIPDDPNDPNFKLPYVSVGDGVGTTVGGWHISTSWLQVFFPNAPDSVTFPGIEFIFAPIEFGSLNLFGISIDLDFMAMAMAGVLMFKVITR